VWVCVVVVWVLCGCVGVSKVGSPDRPSKCLPNLQVIS